MPRYKSPKAVNRKSASRQMAIYALAENFRRRDACRLALELAEDALIKIWETQPLARELTDQFWKAGGVTAQDFEDFASKQGRFSNPTEIKTKGYLRLVVNRQRRYRRSPPRKLPPDTPEAA
jgi:hypothetical protein